MIAYYHRPFTGCNRSDLAIIIWRLLSVWVLRCKRRYYLDVDEVCEVDLSRLKFPRSNLMQRYIAKTSQCVENLIFGLFYKG